MYLLPTQFESEHKKACVLIPCHLSMYRCSSYYHSISLSLVDVAASVTHTAIHTVLSRRQYIPMSRHSKTTKARTQTLTYIAPGTRQSKVFLAPVSKFVTLHLNQAGISTGRHIY